MLQTDLAGPTRWIVPLAVLGGVLAAGIVLRAVVYSALHRWARKTTTPLDDLLIASTKWPSYLWILIVAVLVAVQTVDLPGEEFDRVVRRALAGLLIFSITVGASRFLAEAVQHYRAQVAPDLAIASTGLLRTIVRIVTLTVGILVLLATLGINIAPILGALGVGGLAVGLALQPTLSNLFAGFQIAMARQIRLGHRVRLASGEEGYVADISWRTTTLRTPGNHLVIIPNSKFADSIVTNYDMPDAPANIVVPVGVSYDADPRRVEAVLRDEAQRLVADRPEFAKDFEPVVRLQSFGESALQFQIVLQVTAYDAQYAVWGEVLQRIHARLAAEGIRIPYPTRTVHLWSETGAPTKR